MIFGIQLTSLYDTLKAYNKSLFLFTFVPVMNESLNILVSPLDWGLGHASRLVPLLQYLESQGHLLHIGVNTLTDDFLRQNVKSEKFYPVPSYRIKYSRFGTLPSFAKIIWRLTVAKNLENNWVKDFVANQPVDLIISDNRFGFYHEQIPSVIISHQLHLQFSKGWKFLGKYAQNVNSRWLSAFSEVWVPDDENHLLSGHLSQNESLKVRYIGGQSRLVPQENPVVSKRDYILCILSGPEPQRSYFEKLVRQQSPLIRKQIIMLGGKPHQKSRQFECANLTYYNHVDNEQMAALIQNADLVLSRSGYSSIMDYHKLCCRHMFFIPTPGQPEQLYLAQRFKEMGVAGFQYQDDLNLPEIIAQSKLYHGFERQDAGTSVFTDSMNDFFGNFTQPSKK